MINSFDSHDSKPHSDGVVARRKTTKRNDASSYSMLLLVVVVVLQIPIQSSWYSSRNVGIDDVWRVVIWVDDPYGVIVVVTVCVWW